MILSRRILVLVVVLAIAGAIAWAIAGRHAPAVPEAHPAPQVPLATVRDGLVEQTLELTGRVGPAAGTQVKLAFPLSGTLGRVNVRLGEHVDAGTPLASLDATSYALAAQQAGADAVAAAANAAVARVDRVSVKLRADEAELHRQQRLYAAGIVALRDVQSAAAQVAADRADAQSARGQIDAAQAQARSANVHASSASYDLSRTTLRAPSAGIVVGIYAQAGQAVDPTVPVVAVAAADEHTAVLDVPVDDVTRISTGDLVRGRAAGQTFEGHVAGVAPSIDPVTGLAVISVGEVPDTIAPGTPVDATVVTGHVRGLVIPRGAVVQDPQTGNMLVFVVKRTAGGSVGFSAREVTVDAQDADHVRVVTGLRSGERVAAAGAIDLLATDSGGD